MSISALSVQQIVAVIRQQIAAPINKQAGQAASAATGTPRKAGSRSNTRSGKGSVLSGLIAKRVGALDKADPDRGRKAFRIFLESILLAEFGDALINDPAFYQMVDDVQIQMEKNPDVAALMRQATTQLLNGANPNSIA